MSDDPFLGVVLVARQASSQAQVVFQYPKDQVESGSSVFGIGLIEFGKFSLPAKWLMNRKLDFEIESCGPSLSNHSQTHPNLPEHGHPRLRFISFPCECAMTEENRAGEAPAIPLVTAFNVVFVFDGAKLTEEAAELFWQALATISRAFIVEEQRDMYLSNEVSMMLSKPTSDEQTNLSRILVNAYEGVRSEDRGVSLYVNDSVLTHIGVIPFGEAPEPPAGHQALLLTCDADSLQAKLPVDSASNVRRLIDAGDPSKTIKDHMIELGLPISTIQRISQHMVYWRKAKIVHPLNKRIVLSLSPCSNGVYPSTDFLAEFKFKFGLKLDALYFRILYAFSQGKKLSDVKDVLLEEIPQLTNKFSEMCVNLLSKGILTYSAQFFRYFPPLSGARVGPGPGPKRFPGGGFSSSQRPKFQNQLPHEIRCQYSPAEFEIIFERLRYNSIGSELMIKLISNYVKKHKDLLTARVELNEQNRCTNEDFHKYTEALMGGYLDSLLVKYECDV